MPDAFPVQLVSPEQILFDGEAEMVVCRPIEGSIAFLTGHVPYLGALADDEVRIILPGAGEEAAAVHGGFVQMTGDNLVVLSDLAELTRADRRPPGRDRPSAGPRRPSPATRTTKTRWRHSPGPRPASRSPARSCP